MLPPSLSLSLSLSRSLALSLSFVRSLVSPSSRAHRLPADRFPVVRLSRFPRFLLISHPLLPAGETGGSRALLLGKYLPPILSLNRSTLTEARRRRRSYSLIDSNRGGFHLPSPLPRPV